MAELKWLEDLLALMEEDSFTKAAARRHVTQPAFSRRIRQLEHWLGIELVDSQRKPIRILPLTREHESQIRSLVHDFYHLRNSLQDSHRQQRTSFVVQHTLAVSHFPDLIQRMYPALAHNAYRLQTANNEDCVGLFNEQTSFMLCYELPGQRVLSDGGEFARIKLDTEYLLPMTSPGRLDDSQQIVPQTTNHTTRLTSTALPLLMFPKSSFLADVLAAGCLPAVMRDYPVDIVCESAFAISLKEMVLAGMGIAWLPSALVRKELAEQKLISLADQLGHCELNVSLYYRCNGYADDAFRVLSVTGLPQNTDQHAS